VEGEIGPINLILGPRGIVSTIGGCMVKTVGATPKSRGAWGEVSLKKKQNLPKEGKRTTMQRGGTKQIESIKGKERLRF